MIRSGVERTKRAASRRIIVRALVVGGFAGAAWLLSASGAQAADAQQPEASSALSPLTGVLDSAAAPVLDAASAVVGGVLTPSDPATAVVLPGATATRSTVAHAAPAAKPARPAFHHADSADAAPAVPAAEPANTLDGLVTPLGVTRVLAGPTGPLSPVTRVVDPVLAPLGGALRPVNALLRFAAAPLATTLDAVIRTASGVLPGPRGGSVSAVTPGRFHGGAFGAASAASAVSAHVPRRASHTERVASIRPPAGTSERIASARPMMRLGTGDSPSRTPFPAPLRDQLGTGAEIPASGSRSHAGGGGFATVPSAVAGSMVEFHRLPEPTGAAVLRHDAEDPTVSPD
jgi:hypothetical protein